jgi:cysteine-rich repeat protein
VVRTLLRFIFPVVLLLAYPAKAQDTTTTTIFLVTDAADSDLHRALEDHAADFRAQLTRTGRYRFAGTREMEAVVSVCREQIGASATEDRACQLQAARVSAMDHLIELFAAPLGDRTELTLRVLEAENNEEIFGAWELAAGTPTRAVEAVLPLLATAYDRWMTGTDQLAACYPPPANPESAFADVEIGAVLEILGTIPSTVSVRVNGVDVGLGPGQFFGLDPGPADVELNADGCETARLEVELVDGEVVTVEDVRLEFLPGSLVVSASIAGVTVFANGSEVGTIMTEPLEIELPPGGNEIEVRRPGYRPFARTVDITPGGRQTLHAELVTQICGDGVVEGSEECDDDNSDDGDGCSADCRREPPALLIDCGVGGAEVTVDGELVARTGADGTARVELTEGRHRVEVSSPGFMTDSTTVEAAVGRVETRRMALIEAASDSSAAPWIVVGLGAALIVGGVAVDVASSGDLDELSTLRDACIGGDTSGCTADDLDRGGRLSADLESAADLSVLLYGAGAAAVLIGVIWELAADRVPTEARSEATHAAPGLAFDLSRQWGFHVSW